IKSSYALSTTVVPNNFVSFRNQLYFSGSDGVSGNQLWRTDGTEAGTVSVSDALPTGSGYEPYGLGPYGLSVIGNQLYFFSSSGNPLRPYGVWKSDGISPQVSKLGEFAGAVGQAICPMLCGNNSPNTLVELGETAFFIGDDDGTPSHFELWRSDGTSAHTAAVREASSPGAPYISSPHSLISLDGMLYFLTNYGGGLWRSDGTAAG